MDHDPVYQTALIARRPFAWRDIMQRGNLSRQSRQVMNEAHENKLYNGIGLSIYRPFGEIIGIGISSSEKNLDCDKHLLDIVYAGANQFYTAYSDLVGPKPAPAETPVSLTDREREVLLWIVRGKSKTETASILNISESGIKRHCENIFMKLDVNNLQLAIVKALRLGLIQPF